VANALGIGPDMLKKRVVKSVESSIPGKLVGSAAKALKPGEASRLVLDHASRFFSQARDLTRDLEELAGLQAPEIVFGIDMFAAELTLGVALGRMATVNSRLRVHAVIGDFETHTRDVLAGRLEFAVADTTSAERHPSRLAIEPVAEHRVFFFARPDHPLTEGNELTLASILAFPLVTSRIPQRIAVHLAKAMTGAKVNRDTGNLNPNLMLDSFAVAKGAVAAGDAVGLAPLTAIEQELRSGKFALVPFDAPWLHMSYGLFYPRKKAMSRAAQLFVTQLRQVETALQVRERRLVSRNELRQKPRRASKPKSKAKAGKSGGARSTGRKRAVATRRRP
jgi:DNA-binding transcriptional LysR family regulator